jgi:two-component system, NtrC family, response regulator AtoC
MSEEKYKMPTKILLVDDEPSALAALGKLVGGLGHDVVFAGGGAEAITRLENESYDLCVTDLEMPEVDGFAVLMAAQKFRPGIPVLVLTGEATVRDAVAALRAGATDFIAKPFHAAQLAETVQRTLGVGVAANEGFPRHGAAVVGEHPAIRLMLDRIDQVAGTDATVLIRGETGTGTELVARLVHASSPRRSGPFISVNLTGLPEPVADAVLFGAGPFGTENSTGQILAAQHGTLFLSEIGDLPRGLQAKMLRLLQDREISPPDGSVRIPLDLRVITADSRSLEPMVREGTFHDGLYYSLNVIPIEVPPLRARKEDIELLTDYFRRHVNAREGRSVPAFSPELLKRLCSYDWPGNVRQLELITEKLVRAAGNRAVTTNDLPPTLRTDVTDLGVGIVELPPFGVDLRLLLTQLEDRLIGQALQRTGGNKNRAAELLGMNRTTLVEKLRRRNVA